MSSNKRLILLFAFATFLLIAWTAPGEAQVYGPPHPYPYYAVDRDSALRIEATPKEAQVYVDGYYAGIVDDFDGFFQKLRLPPGEHEVALFREGYRTVRQNVYLTPNSTFKVHYTMERLAPGEPSEPRPVPPPPPQPPQPGTPPQAGQPTPPSFPPRGPVGRGMPPPDNMPPPNNRPPPNYPPPNYPQPGSPLPPAGQPAVGTLTIAVQPPDAEIQIDGQATRVAAGEDRLVIDVSEGPHTVHVRKQGYVEYLTQVQVRRGETMPLNINLRTRP